MYSTKDNWKRFPQHKPSKGYGWYKTLTASGKSEIHKFSQDKQWNTDYILAFVDELVPQPTPKSAVTQFSNTRKSLFREYMDAGNYTSPSDYTQFTDVESPVQVPMKNQLNQLLGLLPDNTALEQLQTTLETFKTMTGGMSFESPSNSMELQQLVDDIRELREKLKSIIARVDGLTRDMHVDTKPEKPYETGMSHL